MRARRAAAAGNRPARRSLVSFVAVATAVAMLGSSLAAGFLRHRYDTGPAPGIAAVGKPLMDGEGALWTATVPHAGAAAPRHTLKVTRGCGDLYRWATSRGAVPRGTAAVAYSVAAPADTSVVIEGIRVVKGARIATPRGDDVGCAGAVDPTVAGLPEPDRLDLDGRSPEKRVLRPVRPGGTTGGTLHITTRTCWCEWWVELDVVQDGKARTIRVDDGGEPFRVAPPARRLASGADLDVSAPVPLSRANGDPREQGGVSVRGYPDPVEFGHGRWLMETQRPVDAPGAIGGNLDVAGVSCARMRRAVTAAGGITAGHTTFDLQITAPVEAVTVDAAVHIHRVWAGTPRRHHYGCAAPGWRDDFEYPLEDRGLYLDTLHVIGVPGGGSLKYDPDWRPEDGEGKRILFSNRESLTLHRRPDRWSRDIFGGVNAQQATFSFSLEVTVTLPSGEARHFTVDDNGEPFVLAPGAEKSPPLVSEEYREVHRR
ncbi:hypothetical protein IHE55_29500 [Streptomyces pactum]|uniref:Tat pathway signal sequence domain protein n=1 Tax=Streptomyces pactum TaxID=68249 RepID=A0ABS0NU11_9ACTN|nr:hypothetical protein [Streptomyces pactum]MBH5338692.1 hypothetical protein [Streptomyces pactum]